MDIFGTALDSANIGFDFDWSWMPSDFGDLGFGTDTFSDGFLDFDPTEWGVEDSIDTDIFDFDWGSDADIAMEFDPGIGLDDAGGFMDDTDPLDLAKSAAKYATSSGSSAINQAKKLLGSKAGSNAQKVAVDQAKKLAKKAMSPSKSPSKQPSSPGTTESKATGLGGLGEGFALPPLTKLGALGKVAPTVVAPKKAAAASRAGVEAARIPGRGRALKETTDWLGSVAMAETYSTSYTPSLSKRYSIA